MGRRLRVHRGHFSRNLLIRRWHPGHPVGSFARSRRPAVFQEKSRAKKKLKQGKSTSRGTRSGAAAPRVVRLLAVQRGAVRRAAVLNPAVEAQLRVV